MKLPEKLNKCPKTPECSAKLLYRDDEGNLYTLNIKGREFRPHICNTRNSGVKPSVAYLGEWYNKETKRTRWLGPERLRRTVEKPPYDERYRRRGSQETPWILKRVLISELDWKPAPPNPS